MGLRSLRYSIALYRSCYAADRILRMTAFDYNASAATVTRLLTKFGASATLKSFSGTAYDPSTGTNAPTYTPLPTTAAVFSMAQKYINGTTILQGDQTALVDPGVTPKQGDVLTW